MNFLGIPASTPVMERAPGIGATPIDIGLVGSMLADQWDLSAVDRFAQFHEDADEPLQGRYYSALMPAGPPGPGQQYAFEVDLSRCSGCKACVAACHNLNGLDEGESWREVGLVLGGLPGLPVIQHVTGSCHHCLEPACASACPVDAYEKDPDTGIVRHLDDQCIGCRYCTLACPYDAPKFHAGKGIVRKCDMCHGRLSAGEAPACVQACPHEAIVIRIVDREDVADRADSGAFLPGAPDPGMTRPTTVYLGRERLERVGARPADEHHDEPEEAHWPLIAMLVLTQLSVGGFAVELASGGIGTPIHVAMSLGLGWAGLSASILHLGRPLYAYRAILGFRHSWLSREVLALGVFAKLATAFTILEVLGPAILPAWPALRTAALASMVGSGALGVACSVMVYHAVRRESWRARFSGPQFAGTALILGLATALAALGLAGMSGSSAFDLVAAGLIVATSAVLGNEARLARVFARSDRMPMRKTARLLRGALRGPAALRLRLSLLGGVVLPAVAAFSGNPVAAAVLATMALAVSIAGEIAGRYLFFTSVVRPKMPGGLLP